MIKTWIFSINSFQDDIVELKTMLDKVGFNAEIKRNKSGDYLIINCDTNKFEKVTNRNAGRNPKWSGKTVAQIKDMVEKEGLNFVLNNLQISRSTYFRRWKDFKKLTEGLSEDEINKIAESEIF